METPGFLLYSSLPIYSSVFFKGPWLYFLRYIYICASTHTAHLNSICLIRPPNKVRDIYLTINPSPHCPSSPDALWCIYIATSTTLLDLTASPTFLISAVLSENAHIDKCGSSEKSFTSFLLDAEHSGVSGNRGNDILLENGIFIHMLCHFPKCKKIRTMKPQL